MKVKLALAAMLFAVAAMAQQSARTVVTEDQRLNDININDLFGARDLRIVDIFDLASNGKPEKQFGRIFYAEKKALVFYAFDLQEIKGNGPAFQAWGFDQSTKEKPESLGVFTVENASVEDDPKGSPTPRGQRLLSAYLYAPPNRH
jgi:hypothetical protein